MGNFVTAPEDDKVVKYESERKCFLAISFWKPR
jgi:hypothetical protein